VGAFDLAPESWRWKAAIPTGLDAAGYSGQSFENRFLL